MATVDEKIVRLSMDDSQFDKASDRTISKLDELKKSLEFGGAVNSFDELDKAASQVDMSPLEKGAELVSEKFSALEYIAIGALTRIGSQAVDAGERMLKSLTIDNISDGWSKYADKTAAVQTIMSATANQFEDTGEQMAFVEDKLERLNWFTDETSYKFLDMVNNIGKFTNNAVELETAVTAMEGISTWAASAGANVTEAGRAMYNLSQAIAVGSVKLIDWKSIENANMATVEFKQMVIDTAEELGTLKKVGEKTWQTLAGHDVTLETFSENLSYDNWFTSDVLLKTLDAYGGFADALGDAVDETGVATTTLLGFIEDYIDGSLDMNTATRALGMTADEVSDLLDKLSASEYDLGRKSFAAAQETKTFQEAIDYIKEAVSSGWMQSFEYIFGNYTEAKELWSELSEALYEVFVVSGEVRNGLLKSWKELGGRDTFIDAMRQALSNLWTVWTTMQDAFQTVFPPATVETLINITNGFAKLIEILTPSETMLNNIYAGLVGVFTVLKTIAKVGLTVAAGLDPIWTVIDKIFGGLLGIVGQLGQLLGINLNKIFSDDALKSLYNVLYSISSVIAGIIEVIAGTGFAIVEDLFNFISTISSNFSSGEGGIIGFLKAVGDAFMDLVGSVESGDTALSKAFSRIFEYFGWLINGVASFLSSLRESGSLVGSTFRTFGMSIEDSGIIQSIGLFIERLLSAIGGLLDFASGTRLASTEAASALNSLIDIVKMAITWLVDGFSSLTVKDIFMIILLMELVKSITSISDALSDAVGDLVEGVTAPFNALGDVLGKFGDKNKSLTELAEATKYLQIAAAIGAIVAGLVLISKIPVENLTLAVLSIGAVIAMLALFEKQMANLADSLSDETVKRLTSLTQSLISVSAAIGILGIAVIAIGNQDLISIIQGLASVGILLAGLTGFVYALDKLNANAKNFKKVVSSISTLAVGLTMLSVPILILGSMNLNTLVQGLTAVAVSIAALGAAAAILQKVKATSLMSMSVAIALTATAMTALAIPILILGSMNLPSLVQGLTAIVAAIGSLSIIAALLQNIDMGSFLLAAVGMNAIAAAMVLLMVPIAALGALDIGTLIQGILGATAAIVLLGGALAGLSALAGAGTAVTMAVVAADMILLGGAMTILFGAFLLLNGVDLQALATGIGIMVVAFLGFAGLAAICQVFAAGVGILSAALLAGGIAISLIIGSIKDLVDSLADLLKSINGLFEMVAMATLLSEVFGEDLPSKIEGGFEILTLIFKNFLIMIQELGPDIGDAAAAVFGAIITAIVMTIPQALQALGMLILGILTVLSSMGGPIIDALIIVVNDLTERLPVLIDAIGRFIEELFAGIGVLVWDALIGLIRMMFESIGMGAVGDYIADKMHASTLNAMDSVTDAIVEGAEDVKDTMEEEMHEVGDAGLDGLNESWDRHSPPGEFIEAVTDVGDAVGIGLDAIDGDIFSAFENLGVGAHTSFENGLLGDGNFVSTLYKYFSGAEAFINDGDGTVNTKTIGMNPGSQAAAADVRKAIEEVAAEEGAETGEAAANSWTEALMDGLSSNLGSSATKSAIATTAAEEIKEQSEVIKEAYEEGISEIELVAKRADLENTLWEAVNKDAKEAELVAKNIAYTTKKISYQEQRLNLALKQHQELVNAYGEESVEATNAYFTVLEAQTDLVNLQNDLVDLQNTYISNEQDLLDRMELVRNQRDLEYQLWQAQNPNATEAEQALMERANLSAELEDATEDMILAQDNYNKAVERYGEGSNEAMQAWAVYLKAVIEQTKLQNELTGAAQQSAEDLSANYKNAAAWMRDNTETIEFLRKEFGEEKVQEYIRDTFGLRPLEQAREELAEAAVTSAEEVYEKYGMTMEYGLAAMEPMFSQQGATYTANITEGMTSMTSISGLEEATTYIAEKAYDVANSEDVKSKWFDTGVYIIEGVIEGVKNKEGELYDYLEYVINEALARMMAAADINSPSKETMWIGEMFDKGLENGIIKYTPDTIGAAASLMSQVMDELNDPHTSSNLEFAGRLVAGGIAAGFDDYSYTVLEASQGLIDRMAEEWETNNTLDSAVIRKLIDWGYDLGSLDYEFVLSLNTDKAYEDMTAFERAVIDFQKLGLMTDAYEGDGIDYWTWAGLTQERAGHRISDSELAEMYEQYLAERHDAYMQALDAYYSARNLINNTIKKNQGTEETKTTAVRETQKVEYTQNIYSMKPLSSLDVYRNTNNALQKLS